MVILAIDPGPERSAWCLYRANGGDGELDAFGCDGNDELLRKIRCGELIAGVHRFAVEMIASYGMPVGREVFDTCVWIGRFVEQWASGRNYWAYMYRQQVKSHLCHSAKANDATVRQALIDRFGPGKAKAIGTKKAPGPLYGVTGDVWSALAVAVTYAETRSLEAPIAFGAK